MFYGSPNFNYYWNGLCYNIICLISYERYAFPLFAKCFLSSSIFLLYSLKSERTIFLFFSCLNGNSFPSNFTRNFLISKKFRCCDLNPKSAPSFVPHHQILKTTTHFHCLVRVWEWCGHYLLCRLHCLFCNLLVVVFVAAVVIIFVTVVIGSAIVSSLPLSSSASLWLWSSLSSLFKIL